MDRTGQPTSHWHSHTTSVTNHISLESCTTHTDCITCTTVRACLADTRSVIPVCRPRFRNFVLAQSHLTLLHNSAKVLDMKRIDSAAKLRELKARGVHLTPRVNQKWCGKNCKGCPHQGYAYVYYREDGKLKSLYLGKAQGEVNKNGKG